MRTVFFPHAMAAVLVSGIILLIYAAVQQGYRTAANDPQVQLARDLAIKLKQGKVPGEVLPADTISMENSLSPFLQVYGAAGTPVASTGLLGGKVPVVPTGVLDKARQDGEYMVTWQPDGGVRIAAVLEYTGLPAAQYVLAGRSLVEVEKRENALVTMVVTCWLCCILVICAHAALQGWFAKKAGLTKRANPTYA